jgi:hypothetical protein
MRRMEEAETNGGVGVLWGVGGFRGATVSALWGACLERLGYGVRSSVRSSLRCRVSQGLRSKGMG